MQQHAGLGVAQGGWLAAFNYAGYFCGALIAANISDLAKRSPLPARLIGCFGHHCRLRANSKLLVMGIIKVFSGLSSAAGLLLGSGLVMHWLLRHQLRSELGIHFIGMGSGIFFTALFVYLVAGQISWQQHWFWFTALGCLLAIPAWFWLPKPNTSGYNVGGENGR